MDTFLTAAFDIISFTSIIVLVVLGLGVIASMMGVFNFAHGEFVLLGAFTVYVFHISGLPVWLGMLAAPLVVALFGLFIERTIIRQFYTEPVIGMLVLFAIAVVVRESVRGFLGGLYRAVPAPIIGTWEFGDVSLGRWRLTVLLVALLVVAASHLLISQTTWGLRIRAALQNPSLARVSGISTDKLYAATFAFGAALAGLAGALMVPQFTMFADLGVRFLIWGFLAVMIGGVGSFTGPVLGAIVIGVMAAGFPWVLNPLVSDVLVFVVAIVIVKLRPNGLFVLGRT